MKRILTSPSPCTGVCAVFVTAAFSFAGTELVGLAASETPNPRATMPGAVKGTFWRVILIYVVSLLLVGLLVPWNHPRLLGGGGANASPFVIVFDSAKVGGLNRELLQFVLNLPLNSWKAEFRKIQNEL